MTEIKHRDGKGERASRLTPYCNELIKTSVFRASAMCCFCIAYTSTRRGGITRYTSSPGCTSVISTFLRSSLHCEL